MATPYMGATPFTRQFVIASGVNPLYTCTTGWKVTISGLTFNNQLANDVTMTVIRANPASSVDAYTFTLSAGDVVCDNNNYTLYGGDTIQLTTSANGTNVLFSGILTRQ